MAKTQWHPAFCAAMRLELKDNPALQFTNEFNLTEKPLEVDMLVIKKPADVMVDNPIGEFFKGNNLLEYKSPTDHQFNKYGIYQVLSYAYYYCCKFQTEDVTASLIVSKKHFNIMKWIDSQGMDYTRRYDGIYTLHGINFLKMQIVVTEELDDETFQWLSSLTDNLTETKAKKLVGAAYGLKESEDKRLAESIVQVLTSANGKLFEKIKEDKRMASALMELMKPEVEKYAQDYAEKYAQDYAEKYAQDYAEKYAQNYARKNDMEHAAIMIQKGEDNEYIRLLTHMTDEEIDKLRGKLKNK